MKTIASRNTTTIALVRSGILGGFVATCVGSGGRRAASEKKRWRSYEFVNPVGSEMIVKRRVPALKCGANFSGRWSAIAKLVDGAEKGSADRKVTGIELMVASRRNRPVAWKRISRRLWAACCPRHVRQADIGQDFSRQRVSGTTTGQERPVRGGSRP